MCFVAIGKHPEMLISGHQSLENFKLADIQFGQNVRSGFPVLLFPVPETLPCI